MSDKKKNKAITKVQMQASRNQKKTHIENIRASDSPGPVKRAAIKQERVDFRERKSNIKIIAQLRKNR